MGFACLQELLEDKKNEEEAKQVKCNWLCQNYDVGQLIQEGKLYRIVICKPGDMWRKEK